MLASGLLVSGAATTAVAAEAGGGDADDGVVVVKKAALREGDYIAHVTEPEGKDDGVPGGLIKVTTEDGDTLLAYCLDVRTAVKRGAEYREADRSEVPTLKDNPDAAKVDWVLRHGYPAYKPADLGKLTGLKLSENAAAGGTQAAVWRLTNHVKAVPLDPAGAALADYLVAHAVDTPEPVTPLVLDPETVTGPAGSVLGPITVGTTGDQVMAALDPAAVAAGVVLTDQEGNVVSGADGRLTQAVMDGESLFVKAPAGARPGTATVSATAFVPVPVGHKLVGEDSQALALVTGDRVPVIRHAKVSWTGGTPPSPTPTPTSDPGGSPSPTASPTLPPTASPTASGSPGASASADPSGTPGPDPTSSAGAGGSELASTGSSGALGFVAVAAGGLAVIGALVVLVHEWRRRYRDLD
ncbi:Cys-Gln thioester bond-forming surface protein [Streptomyces sp. NPDC093111]|uniref:Cys-Gln thioester bond-forming surface protein n=1 Tax=Streptomyces sp. NPDC093111 TaxID=3154978 RepID=UPI003442139D